MYLVINMPMHQLFRENFNVNPWSESDWAWMANAAGLAGIAAAQFIYFKRKKWL